ncbi:tape measure protein [Xanthocytophaga agilis]|uniref:Tape measure protein n=1 Tax=Xanthocytophaga agilis TaxID=3048010 RepID=A0AAE3RD66_9BACT|nr:tape measure protein [Xanthocytophaga agilis]MDJ1505523.1 tape measure protein [Xanthocytophaga agilis]
MAGVNELLAALSVKISGDSQQFESAIKKSQDALRGFSASVNTNLARNYQDLDKFNAKWSQGFGRLADTMQSAGKALTVGVSLPLAGLATASVNSYAKLDQLKKGLISASKSAEAGEEEFKKLEAASKLPGLSLNQAVKASINLQAIGKSAEDARKWITELANANALVGGGNQELERVIYGFQQLANTDLPLGEDLNIIKDALPQVNKILKDTFGSARAEDLRKIGVSSKQITDAIIGALSQGPRAATSLGTSFTNLSATIDKSLAKVGDSINKNFDIQGKTEALGKWIEELAVSFSQLTPEAQKTILVMGGIAAATGPVLYGIGAITKAIPTLITGLTTLQTAANGAWGILGKIAIPAAIIGGVIVASSTEDPGKAVQNQQLSEEAMKAFTVSLEKYQKTASDKLKEIRDKLSKEFRQSQFDILRSGSGTDQDAARSVAAQLNGQMRAIDKILAERNASLQESGNKAAALLSESNQKIADALKALNKDLSDTDLKAQAFGSTYDVIGEKVGILEKGIVNLIELGLKPQSTIIQKLIGQYNTLGAAALKSLKATAVTPLSSKGINMNQSGVATLDTSYFNTTFKAPDDVISPVYAKMGENIQKTIIETEPYLKSFNENLMGNADTVQAFSVSVKQALEAFATDTIASFGDALGATIAGLDGFDGFGKALLSSVGDLAQQLGKLTIGFGVAMLGIKIGLQSLNPYVAIAAGTALVALGAYVKGAVSNMGSGIGSGSASSASIQSGLSSSGGSTASAIRTQEVRTNANVTPIGSTIENLFISGRLVIADEGGALVGYINKSTGKINKTGG